MVLDKRWHLAADQKETELTDFELQLWRVFYGFLRWQEGCQSSSNGDDLNAYELAILHIVRMQDRPKTVPEICRLLNREDVSNIIYIIKKLMKLKLIEGVKIKASVVYKITEAGLRNTERYTALRREALVDLYTKQPEFNLEGMTEKMATMKGLYDEAYRITASYKSQ